MTLPLPYVVRDPDVQGNLDKIAMAFPVSSANAAYPNVTALPTTGTNGQVVYYTADATNGVVWAFKYRTAASGSKWEFVGGSPLYVEITTTETTASTSYAALTTAGPSITVPLAGDYMVAIGVESTNSTNGQANYMSYDIGASAAGDGSATSSHTPSGGQYDSDSRERRLTSVAASAAIVSKYKTSAGTASFRNRWMRVQPVRVT